MNKNTIKIQRKLFTYKENWYMIRKISFAQRIFMNLQIIPLSEYIKSMIRTDNRKDMQVERST